MVRPPILSACLLLLVACGSDSTSQLDDTGTPVDTEPTDTVPAYDPFEGAFVPGDLTDPDTVLILSLGSAPNALQLAVLPLTTAGDNGDPSCPAVTSSKGMSLTTGGCTDLDGRTWFGTAVMEDVGGDTVISYLTFGYRQTAACSGGGTETSSATWEGTVTALGDTDRFLLDVGVTIRTADLSACTSEMAELALLYDGTIEVVGTRQTFNGTGAFGYTRVGWAEVSTADEVLDDTVCATEALNGTTRVVSGGDEVVLTYDGAVACSPYGVVPWSLNGVDQGELTGLRCAIGAGPASAWLLFPALLLLRRRGSRERRRA